MCVCVCVLEQDSVVLFCQVAAVVSLSLLQSSHSLQPSVRTPLTVRADLWPLLLWCADGGVAGPRPLQWGHGTDCWCNATGPRAHDLPLSFCGVCYCGSFSHWTPMAGPFSKCYQKYSPKHFLLCRYSGNCTFSLSLLSDLVLYFWTFACRCISVKFTTSQKLGIILKEVSFTRQGCIYLVKNTVKTVHYKILLQFKMTVFRLNIF